VIHTIGKYSEPDYAFTSRKKQGAQGVESPDSFINEFEEVMKPMGSVAEVDDSRKLQVVIESWDNLADNVNRISGLILQSMERHSKRNKEWAQQGDGLHMKVNALKALVGERNPSLFGTQSVVEALTDIMKRVKEIDLLDHGWESLMERVKGDVATIVSQEVATALHQQLFNQEFQDGFWTPMVKLLGDLSTGPDKPGDVLFERLESLEKRLTTLEKQPMREVGQRQNLAGRAGGPGLTVGWNVGTHTNVATMGLPATTNQPPLHGNQQPTADVMAEINSLKAAIRDVRSQVESESVEVEGVWFRSLDETQAWMVREAVESFPHLFMDAISFLSRADTIKVDEAAVASSRVASVRVGDSSPEYTQYAGSFTLEIPPILGKGVDPNHTNTTRTLAALPTYETWDTGMGRDGVKDRLKKIITEGKNTLSEEICNTLSGDAARVALELLTKARDFWMDLSTWITEYYSELKNRNEATPKECWIVTTYCVRAILSFIQ